MKGPSDKPRLDLVSLLKRPSPFANEHGALPIGEFEPLANKSGTNPLVGKKVLVVGAGG